MNDAPLNLNNVAASYSSATPARLVALCSATVIVIASSLLFVWLALPEYKAWSSAQMKANTALALSMAAIALWLLRLAPTLRGTYRHILGIVCAVAVLAIGGLTLVEYIGNWNFGIDQFLVSDFVNHESAMHPGRMSPIAAVCFVLTGLALLLIDRKARRIYRHPSSLLLLPVILLAILALVGYLYGVTSFYKIGPYIRIAWLTAFCFAVLALGTLIARSHNGPIGILFSPGSGGYMARRMIPVTVVLPVAIGVVRMQLERAGYVNLPLGTALLVVTLMLVFYSLIVVVSHTLEDIDMQRAELLKRERAARAQTDIERQRLHSLFMQTPLVINILRGPEHVFELQNPASRALVGGRDLTGITVRDAVPEYEGQGWIELLDRVYAGKPYFGKEMFSRLRQPDGRFVERYFDSHYETWRDLDGSIVGIINVAIDVTESVKARKALEESEELFRSAFNLAAVAMCQVDTNTGRMVRVNSKMEQMVGYTAAELAHLSFVDITHPDDRERDRAAYLDMINNKTPVYVTEKRYIHKDGKIVWALLSVAAVRDSTGRAVHGVSAILDITSMKATEQDLKKAIQARDEFLSMASHEFQTPLTSLMLQTQSMLRAVSKGDAAVYAPERVNKLLEQTEKQVTRLSRLMNDMLDVSRLRTGKLALEKSSVDLGELVQEVIERLRPQFVNAAHSVPNVDIRAAAVGLWDRLRIEQIITNLLTNAMRYGGGKPIDVRVETTGKTARLTIRDYGIGIAAENHERIFNRFERAVTANEASGLGLGLFITHELVQAHDGRVWVESELGKGASFFVELPLAASTPP